MSDLGSGLKEFGQQFTLASLAGFAENIKKKDEEDRKTVREHVKLLRSNIAKNKALDAKLKIGLQGQLNYLTSNLGGVPRGFYKDVMSTEDNFNAVKKAIQADTNKTGYWFKNMSKQYGIKNTEDIYKQAQKEVNLSDIRTSTGTYAPTVDTEEEKDLGLKDIFKLGFGVPDPVGSLRRAEIKVAGRGNISESEIRFAYGTPSRGIKPSGLPFSIRGERITYSEAEASAVHQAMEEKEVLLIGQSERFRPILKELYEKEEELNNKLVESGNQKNPPTKLKQDISNNRKAIEAFHTRTYVDYRTRMIKTLNAIAKGTMEAEEIQKLLGNNASEADAIQLIDAYHNQLVSYNQMLGRRRKGIFKEGTTPSTSSVLDD